MFTKLFDFKFHVAYILSLIFAVGVFYQKTEATATTVKSIANQFVRKDVQYERDTRISEKLDMLLSEIEDLKIEIRNLRSK